MSLFGIIKLNMVEQGPPNIVQAMRDQRRQEVFATEYNRLDEMWRNGLLPSVANEAQLFRIVDSQTDYVLAVPDRAFLESLIIQSRTTSITDKPLYTARQIADMASVSLKAVQRCMKRMVSQRQIPRITNGRIVNP